MPRLSLHVPQGQGGVAREALLHHSDLGGSLGIVVTDEDEEEVPQEPLAVLKDDWFVQVQSQDHDVEEEGQVGGPAVLDVQHKLREQGECKVASVECGMCVCVCV